VLQEQQPAPVVTTSDEDSHRAEATMALQSLSLLREGRSAGVEPVPETQPVSEPGNSSATLEISESLVQVKRLDRVTVFLPLDWLTQMTQH